MYLPEVRCLFQGRDPVLTVRDSLLEDRQWWARQVYKAAHVFQGDLQQWLNRHESWQARQVPPTTDDLPYACHVCSSRFPLRKHLAVHLSRSHQILAPTRHFAPTTCCLSCHREYGLVSRVQMHLDRCLRRLARLIPPMSVPEIQEAERAEKCQQRRQRAGHWREFVALDLQLPLSALVCLPGRNASRLLISRKI